MINGYKWYTRPTLDFFQTLMALVQPGIVAADRVAMTSIVCAESRTSTVKRKTKEFGQASIDVWPSFSYPNRF
jgi:hypothetical protein